MQNKGSGETTPKIKVSVKFNTTTSMLALIRSLVVDFAHLSLNP
jgi:hypothetical protein